jgi:predicted nuclease of restriction endonuclease-like (RecB) superfamily
MANQKTEGRLIVPEGYQGFASGISQLLEEARRRAAKSVNFILTATYWEIGRRIIEFDQKGQERAAYGQALLERLSGDLIRKFGRGFSSDRLELMRRFYLGWPPGKISATLSRKLAPGRGHAPILKSTPDQIAQAFPLSWSQYTRLLRVDNLLAREFYETEALRGGWSVRQLNRQIESQFYERTALSRDKAAMLTKGSKAKPDDRVTPEEEIKSPYVLEFLGLKDEYSESELEEALILHLESFLLELGGDFAFLSRQKRLRVGDAWYRVDLVFYHRRLRCLVLIDLKLGSLTHADAGQMHLYLNYAREHWTHKDENPPVGLILCAKSDAAVAHYALEGLPNKVLASEYRTVLPKERTLAAEVNRTRAAIETHRRLEK